MTLSQFCAYILQLIFAPNSPVTMEWKMLRLLNKDRQKHGLKPVFMHKDLRKPARKHSFDMSVKNYFDHVNKENLSPQDRLKIARITETVSGENLAKIREYANPVLQAQIGLMNSPGHKANILTSDFNSIGIGVIKAKDGTYYFTQNFAHREIFFSKRIPRTIRLKKGLKVKGKTLSKKIPAIIYQIHQNQILKNQGIIKIIDKKFENLIKFPRPGLYQVTFFIPGKKFTFKGLNKFEIKVKKGILF